MEALYRLRQYVSLEIELIEERKEGIKVIEERRAGLKSKAHQARIDLERVTAIGAFVVSEDAVSMLSALQQAFRSAEAEETWYEYLESQLIAIQDGIAQFRELAKRDLKVA